VRGCPYAALLLTCCGGAVASSPDPVATYGTVAAICTARKQALLDRAESPPSPPETAAYNATRQVCEEILDEIERKAE